MANNNANDNVNVPINPVVGGQTTGGGNNVVPGVSDEVDSTTGGGGNTTASTFNATAGLKLVPTFDGSSKLNVEIFLENIDKVGQIMDWRNPEKMLILNSRCRGEASAFLNDNEEIRQSSNYPEIKRLFLARFKPVIPLSSRVQNLMACKQGSDETVSAFAARIKKAGSNIMEGVLTIERRADRDRIIQSAFLKGLNDRIRRFVLSRKPTSLKEAEDIAIEEEDNENLVRGSKNVNLINAIDFVGEDNEPEPFTLNDVVSELRNLTMTIGQKSLDEKKEKDKHQTENKAKKIKGAKGIIVKLPLEKIQRKSLSNTTRATGYLTMNSNDDKEIVNDELTQYSSASGIEEYDGLPVIDGSQLVFVQGGLRGRQSRPRYQTNYYRNNPRNRFNSQPPNRFRGNWRGNMSRRGFSNPGRGNFGNNSSGFRRNQNNNDFNRPANFNRGNGRTFNGNRNRRGNNNSNRFSGNMSEVQCYRCFGLGHFASNCPSDGGTKSDRNSKPQNSN
jgi:hypothetical protein